MEQLKTWLNAQIEEKKVEPNSGMGQAIAYMLRHWNALTLFLRKEKASLDKEHENYYTSRNDRVSLT